MPGDRVTAEGGGDVESTRTRAGRAPQVMTLKQVAFIAGLFSSVTGVSVGAAAFQVIDTRVERMVRAHDKDPEAHALLVRAMERVQQASSVDDAEKARLQAQLDALSRDVRETREAVIRLEAQLRRGSR